MTQFLCLFVIHNSNHFVLRPPLGGQRRPRWRRADPHLHRFYRYGGGFGSRIALTRWSPESDWTRGWPPGCQGVRALAPLVLGGELSRPKQFEQFVNVPMASPGRKRLHYTAFRSCSGPVGLAGTPRIWRVSPGRERSSPLTPPAFAKALVVVGARRQMPRCARCWGKFSRRRLGFVQESRAG